MVFSDGECPCCGVNQLSLNISDLLECPQCHLVCANPDGLLASIMPFLGSGEIRLEDGNMAKLSGTIFAKARINSVLPDEDAIFGTQLEIQQYVEQLQQ